MEPTTPIIHDRSDYLKVVFGNTTFLINPKIHFHSDNSMIIMDISGENRIDKVNISTIDISGQYIHSYHDISGQHIHTYPDISGLHIHPYMDNIHPYHDVSGWHLPSYRDVSNITYGLHIYPYHDAWGWHMLPSDLSTNDISRNLSRDIGWHIHPHDGSNNMIHDVSGKRLSASSLLTLKVALLPEEFGQWAEKPTTTNSEGDLRSPEEFGKGLFTHEITVLHVKTIDASLNWYYFHHGHPVDLSMTDISGIHPKSIHIYEYDYPYPSSTLFQVTHDQTHSNSVSKYFNEFICDIHKIMLGDVTEIHMPESTPFEFPIDFIPDVLIPSLCTYTNVSTTVIDISGNEFIHIVDTITDVSGNQTTCDISATVIDISGSEPILHIVDTITDVSGNQTICDISASVIDISGSEPILNVDITDTSGNHSSYDISAINVERDTSGILQSSTYSIDCSSNSIHVTLSDFGNNLPPYVVYICDVCAKAKLSTQ